MRLPEELTILIFEEIAQFSLSHVDQRVLTNSHARNAALSACALVCRSWTSPAQALLYRDICVGTTTRNVPKTAGFFSEPPKSSTKEPALGRTLGRFIPPSTQLPFSDNYRVGFTGPSIRALIRTLRDMHSARRSERTLIRALHVGIGCVTKSSSRELAFVTHGTAGDLAQLISLCPGLVHLSIVHGHPFGNDAQRVRGALGIGFDETELELLRFSLSRMHIQTYALNNELVFMGGWEIGSLGCAVPTAGCQLLQLLAPNIINLRWEFDVQFNDLLSTLTSLRYLWPDSMPKLETAITLGKIPWVVQEMLRRAPAVKRFAFLQHRYDDMVHVLESNTLEELVVRAINDPVDISGLSALRTLRIVNDGMSSSVLQTLSTAAESVSELWLDMHTIRADPNDRANFDDPWWEDEVGPEAVKLALEEKPSIKRIISVQGKLLNSSVTRPHALRDVAIPVVTTSQREWYYDFINCFPMKPVIVNTTHADRKDRSDDKMNVDVASP
ncbi:hypothetical protein BKA62DRAFT_708927 [Auriculariales sp. MPI-PUGE-AT-0066]|nr:hypothetical protein BKA62DRAFT_708927 [Auriculariales sp. MPI-PUGE-AT-0066]